MGAAALDTALSGDECLPHHLTAEDPAMAIVLARAAIDVIADGFEVEAIQKTLLQGMHAPRGSTPGAPRRPCDPTTFESAASAYDFGLGPTPS